CQQPVFRVARRHRRRRAGNLPLVRLATAARLHADASHAASARSTVGVAIGIRCQPGSLVPAQRGGLFLRAASDQRRVLVDRRARAGSRGIRPPAIGLNGMRVAFDVTPLRVPHSGVGTYTANLLQQLQGFPGDEVLPVAQSSTRRVNKTLWMQVLLPFQLARVAPDVCHFTNSVASCWTPCPAVMTIHDTTLWMFPRYHPR